MDSPPSLRFQFELSTLLWLMGAVGVFLFVWRWMVYFPYWLVFPSGMFLVTWIVAKRNYPPDLIWGLFAISWCLANRTITKGIISSFMIIGGSPSLLEMEVSILSDGYGSTVILPLYLSLPIVSLAWRASRGTKSHARKWLILCSVIGLLDATTLAVSIVVFLKLSNWPWR